MKIELITKYNYRVFWTLFKKCNFNCPYCFQHNEEIPSNIYEILDSVINKINNSLKVINNKKIEISLLGGEPTLIDLSFIISKIEPCNNKIDFKIFTNFSASYEKLKQILDYNTEQKNVKFAVSIHDDVCNFNKYIKKINLLKENIHSISIVILTNKNYLNYLKYKYILNKIGLNLIPQLCKDKKELKILTPKEIVNKIQYFKSKKKYLVNDIKFSKEEIISNNMLDNKIKKHCIPAININENGDIKNCINDNVNIFIDNEIICNKIKCNYTFLKVNL